MKTPIAQFYGMIDEINQGIAYCTMIDMMDEFQPTEVWKVEVHRFGKLMVAERGRDFIFDIYGEGDYLFRPKNTAVKYDEKMIAKIKNDALRLFRAMNEECGQ